MDLMAEKVTIQKGTVQETLAFPLYGRSIANQKYPGIFRDTEAAKIMSRMDYDFSKSNMGSIHSVIDSFEPEPQAHVAVWYGEKEPNMEKAIQKLKRAWPDAEIHPFEGYGHGEIIAHPDIIAKEIREFIGGNHQ